MTTHNAVRPPTPTTNTCILFQGNYIYHFDYIRCNVKSSYHWLKGVCWLHQQDQQELLSMSVSSSLQQCQNQRKRWSQDLTSGWSKIHCMCQFEIVICYYLLLQDDQTLTNLGIEGLVNSGITCIGQLTVPGNALFSVDYSIYRRDELSHKLLAIYDFVWTSIIYACNLFGSQI